jgi:hypothetical protein
MGMLDNKVGVVTGAALSRGSGPIHEYTREIFDQTLEMCLTKSIGIIKGVFAKDLLAPSRYIA